MGKEANQTKAAGGKVNIAESFKAQAVTGDIDLSGKSKYCLIVVKLIIMFYIIDITDNHSMQLCQLIKSHAATGVQNLDLSHNKITDNGIGVICKALSESQIERLVISSNKLTEKCCETLTGALMRNKHLKTLMM